jgi:hypothetical protein
MANVCSPPVMPLAAQAKNSPDITADTPILSFRLAAKNMAAVATVKSIAFIKHPPLLQTTYIQHVFTLGFTHTSALFTCLT